MKLGFRHSIATRMQYTLVFYCMIYISCQQHAENSSVFSGHIRWLCNQQVPNRIIEFPLVSRRHLVASYELNKDDTAFTHVYNKSFLYDNAMASIALCHVDQWSRSENLLYALASLLRKDGSLWFNYSIEVDWPSEQDQDQALIRSGTLAWVGYAYCFYLENCPKSKIKDATKVLFTKTAEKIAQYLVGNIEKNPQSSVYGLVKGGFGEITYEIDSVKKTIHEAYSPRPVQWVSTEHNMDLHLFLSHLYIVTGKEKYKTLCDLMCKNILRKLWSETLKQFVRGLSDTNGSKDTVRALDCASWSALFLIRIGNDSLAQICLNSIDTYYKNSINGIEGYLPYKGSLIYENRKLNEYLFPKDPCKKWGDFPFFWWEGNFGVLLSFWYGDKDKNAKRLAGQWAPLLCADSTGGIAYSTKKIPYQFSEWKSVASTAWYIITSAIVKGKKFSYPFFS